MRRPWWDGGPFCTWESFFVVWEMNLFFLFLEYRPRTGAWEYHRPRCCAPLSFTTVRTAALPCCCPVIFLFFKYLHTEDDTASIYLFPPYRPATGELREYHFPRTRCTAVRTAALLYVLLYVVEVWSVGGWKVHCVVRGGWVGGPFRA